MGRTNGYSKRASKEKQIFALGLLVSKYIPGIQMTFPPVTPSSFTDLPRKEKHLLVESTKAFVLICMEVLPPRGSMRNVRGSEWLGIWGRDASVIY